MGLQDIQLLPGLDMRDWWELRQGTLSGELPSGEGGCLMALIRRLRGDGGLSMQLLPLLRACGWQAVLELLGGVDWPMVGLAKATTSSTRKYLS